MIQASCGVEDDCFFTFIYEAMLAYQETRAVNESVSQGQRASSWLRAVARTKSESRENSFVLRTSRTSLFTPSNAEASNDVAGDGMRGRTSETKGAWLAE